MKVALGKYDDADLRRLASLIEQSFARIRPDDALIVGGGTTITRHLSAERAAVAAADYSHNPILANTTATFDITVAGAAPGDVAHASPGGDVGAGLVWSAHTSAADTVRVTVGNVTTADIVPSTRDWRAAVWQY
jgi:hypothetical protein